MNTVVDKKWILYGLFSLVSVLGNFNTTGQSLRNIERRGIRYFESGNYVMARDHFLVLSDSAWNENTTASYLAQCYLELHEPLKSREVLSQLSNPDQENIYLSIIANYFSENFEVADSLLENFQEGAFDIQSVRNDLHGATSNYEASNGYIIQNFGDKVNTSNREYSALMYNDYNKLLFTSRKEQSSTLDKDGLAFEEIYSTSIDSTGNWREPVPLEMGSNQDGAHAATVQIYDSGTKMISYHDGNLYTSSLKDGVWSRDDNLVIDDNNGTNTHCFITPDEQTIFFASDYLSDGKDLDLYVLQKDGNDSWSKPKPLTVFNTKFDEDSPFLASDSTFYFSSRGHDSMGGYDIFKSKFDPIKNEWSAPENLGHPINTVAEDTYYTTDGKLGYMSSTRPGGYGSLDLYRVFLFNKVMIAGILLDEEEQPVTNAEIEIKYDSTTLRSYSDTNGYYEMVVPINTTMKVTFIKDSLNLYEGEYIVNIFFKDKNDNEFNFHIDYKLNEPVLVGGIEDYKTVRHINVTVKNDYSENLIISSVPKKEEKAWSDSLNIIEETNRKKGVLKRVVDLISTNLNIKEAVITTTVINDEVADKEVTYAVQILAMTIPQVPDHSFFDKLDRRAVVHDINGKDGLRRFYLGEYTTKRRALQAMRSLRMIGYDDAFVREMDMYSKL